MTDQKRIFIENTWYAAAWDYEIADANNLLARTICEKPLVFYRTKTGEYVALDDRCCHRAARLSDGRVEGDCLRCMYHGILFDATGKAVEIPGQDHISSSMKVPNYKVCEKGSMIWIWMGDPDLANEDDIYDFPPLSETDKWRGFEKKAYLHYQSNWLLIVDNLADFSHVAFVHTNTLGGSEAYAYSTLVEDLEYYDDGYSSVRWHYNSDPAPFHSKLLSDEERLKKVDRCNTVNMHLPGVFLMETMFAPAGWDKEKNDRSECYEYRNCQFMTPETRDTTHFFWDYLRGFDLENKEFTKSLQNSLLEGFLEDKVIIEAQQKTLNDSPEFVPRTIAADAAFAHFRIKHKKRLKQEDEDKPLVIKENKRRIQ